MRIGQLAERTGTTAKTLRFSEQAGLLPAPERTPSGHRDDDHDVLDRLAFVEAAQAAGLSSAQIRVVIGVRDDDGPPCERRRSRLPRHPDSSISLIPLPTSVRSCASPGARPPAEVDAGRAATARRAAIGTAVDDQAEARRPNSATGATVVPLVSHRRILSAEPPATSAAMTCSATPPCHRG